MNIPSIFKNIIFSIACIYVSAVSAQANKSMQIMNIADQIHEIAGITTIFKETDSQAPLATKQNWSRTYDMIEILAINFRTNSLQAAIIESKSSIDLRQYRFGNKKLNINNQDEFEISFAVNAVYFQKLLEMYEDFSKDSKEYGVIAKRLAAVKPLIDPLMNQIQPKLEKKYGPK